MGAVSSWSNSERNCARIKTWEMNWVAYNHGHDVALPGSGMGVTPFLMYPNGETAQGRLDSLDPTTFRYELRARALSA
jgi:hypothetical protein